MKFLSYLVISLALFWSNNGFGQDIQKRTLRNGLDVVVIPSSVVPVATIEITVKNGAFTEPPEFNGLSHLYEHMFFKGNALIPNQEAYLKRIRELGIVFNGTTSTERVNYFFTLPSDNVLEGLEFMRAAITSPRFDEAEFQKEKQVVLGEVDRNESNPYYWLSRAINEKLWYAHPTRKDPLGDRQSIIDATTAQMRQMKDTYYVPNNAVLMITGDVQAEEAFKMAEDVFSSWTRGRDPFARNPVPAHPPLKKNEAVLVVKDVQMPSVSFNWHGPSVDADPKATFAADVLSYIIAQPSSQFQKNLVDSGITLNSYLSYYTQRYTGPISLSAQVQPDKLEDAIQFLLRETEKFSSPDYYTDEQLESAKTLLVIDDLYGREQMSSFTHTVSFWWATAGLDYYLNYLDGLRSVTRDDINRYVAMYIRNRPWVLGVIASQAVVDAKQINETKLLNLGESAISK